MTVRLRAPVPADASAVHAVLAARETADLGAPKTTFGDLRDAWAATELDLDRDAVVAELDGAGVAAYATVRRIGSLAAVAPAHEGRGIGPRVLAWVEARERERAARPHRQLIAATNSGAAELLLAAGYRLAGSNLRMVRPFREAAGGLTEPDLRVDVVLRALDTAADAERLHELDEISFADEPLYESMSLAAFREELLGAHDLDPELSGVATDGGEIAGFLLCLHRRDDAVAYVNVLAVDPAHRRRGIATALLRRTFAAAAAVGLRHAQLTVDADNEPAVRLYERAGMRPHYRSDIYERALDTAAPAAVGPRDPAPPPPPPQLRFERPRRRPAGSAGDAPPGASQPP